MNKNGFTLIELLAVIIILGIVGTIVTMKVVDVIRSSDKDTFEISARGLLDAVNKYYVKNYGELQTSGKKTFTITDGQFVGDSIKLNGTLPNSATIELNADGTVGIAMTDGKLCARKLSLSNNINVTESNICTLHTPDSCFTISEGEITSYNYYSAGCGPDLSIPSTINGQTVTSIAPGLLDLMSHWTEEGVPALTSLELPNTLVSIGDYAFNSTIDGYCMSDPYHSFRTLNIPDSVTYIGTGAFGCSDMEELNVGSGLDLSERLGIYFSSIFASKCTEIDNLIINVSEDNPYMKTVKKALYSKDGTKLLFGVSGMEDSIEQTVTEIGANAFYCKSISSVTIPNGVTKIGYMAFSDNQLTDVTIPNSVTQIESGAFLNNQLTHVTIPSGVTTISGGMFGSGPFAYNQLESVTIPDTVTSIGDYAFCNNQLTNITLPSALTTIGERAFKENKLTTLTIPSRVTSIGEWAFSYNNLTNVYINRPNSTGITIGEEAFNYNGPFHYTNVTPIYNG